MSTQQPNNTAYGFSQALIDVPQKNVVASRNPTGTDKAAIGTTWINSSTNTAFILTSISNNNANWLAIGGSNTATTAFLAVLESDSDPIDDLDPYLLGATTALTTIFDTTNNLFPGDGSGSPAVFTAPTTGKYYLNMCVAGIGAGSASGNAIVEIGTTMRAYDNEFFLTITTTDYGSMSFSVCADLNALDEVNFNVLAVSFSGNFVVHGSAAANPVTWISGFLI
jgi:hypothetical protein